MNKSCPMCDGNMFFEEGEADYSVGVNPHVIYQDLSPYTSHEPHCHLTDEQVEEIEITLALELLYDDPY